MTRDDPILLRARGLAAGHGRRVVLRGVDLEVRAGEFWFFLGANAQGKSTLLHTLLGVLPPLHGTIERGVPRSAIGFVPQRCDLAANLPTTPREFVSLGLTGLGLDRDERDRRVHAVLEQVGLGGRERDSYWSLSGGQRQRALVARALARRPCLLCVDEPMNNLDLVTERALLDLLVRRNRDEGLTIVYVTHDVGVADSFATHCALAHAGRVDAGPRGAILEPVRLEVPDGAPGASSP